MTSFDFIKLIKEKTLCGSFNIAEKIYEKITGLKYNHNLSEEVNFSKVNQFLKLYEEKPGYPYEYILGYINSFNKQFIVNENVLIPRQETEYLIEEIIKREENKKDLKICDVCTGSGYIAICLSTLNHKVITAIDISKEALEIANQNSKLNNVNVDFLLGSYLDPVINNRIKYDIITCNPPYITSKDDYSNTILYEPKIALFTNDPIKPYEEVLKNLDKVLEYKGTAYFETSSLHHNEYLKLASKFYQFTFEYKKDYSNKYRYMVVKFK